MSRKKPKIFEEHSESYLKQNSQATERLKAAQELESNKEEAEKRHEERIKREKEAEEREKNLTRHQLKKLRRKEKRQIVKDNLAQMETFGEKASYIIFYYKYAFIGIALALFFVGYFTYMEVTATDCVFRCVYMNDQNMQTDQTFPESLEKKMQEAITYDKKEEHIEINQYQLDVSGQNVGYYGNGDKQQKLFMYMSNGLLDMIISDEETMQWYAKDDNFIDLEQTLPKKLLEKVKPYLKYCEDSRGVQRAYAIDFSACKLYKNGKCKIERPVISVFRTSKYKKNSYKVIEKLFSE